MNNLDLLIPSQTNEVGDRWTWATVTQASPLRIRLDGDEAALPITPECLFWGPTVGQRVWVQLSGHRVIVHAPTGGDVNLPVGETTGTLPYNASQLPYPIRGGRKDTALNLNTAPEALNNGFWCAAPGSSNLPTNASYHLGWTVTHDPVVGGPGAWVTQYAQPMTGGVTRPVWPQLFYRRCEAGTWQAWRGVEPQPISRAAASVYRNTNMPNDGVLRTVHGTVEVGAVPINAVQAVVTISVNAHTAANAQCVWTPLIWNGEGGWHTVVNAPVHNHGNPALNMGGAWTAEIDVRPHVRNGQNMKIAMNAYNDPGSGAWVDVGALNYSITYRGYTSVA